MNFSKIKYKGLNNYQPDYCEYLALRASWEFFREYKNIVYEESFLDLFSYHEKEYKKEILSRIKNVDKKFIVKSIKIDNLLPEILQDKIKNNDLNNYFKASLQVFFYSYKKLINVIYEIIEKTSLDKLYSCTELECNMHHLSKLVIDSLDLLQNYESYNNIKPYRTIGYNRSVQSYELFWYTNGITNGFIDYTNNAYFLNLAFLLRDSIEVRLKNALGIHEIYSDNQWIRITSNIFIDFICDNNNINLPSPITKHLLKKIFTWCNYHIHMGIILYEWQYLLIYEYLIPLFSAGKTETQWNLSGAISMKKEYYKNDLVNDLKKYLSGLKIKADNIVLKNKPEAMLI